MGKIFLLSTSSRPVLEPTQPPIPWITRALFPGIKRPRREGDHPPPTTAEVKEYMELYIHFLICLHSIVLN
jgi:hypothetical protein